MKNECEWAGIVRHCGSILLCWLCYKTSTTALYCAINGGVRRVPLISPCKRRELWDKLETRTIGRRGREPRGEQSLIALQCKSLLRGVKRFNTFLKALLLLIIQRPVNLTALAWIGRGWVSAGSDWWQVLGLKSNAASYRRRRWWVWGVCQVISLMGRD